MSISMRMDGTLDDATLRHVMASLEDAGVAVHGSRFLEEDRVVLLLDVRPGRDGVVAALDRLAGEIGARVYEHAARPRDRQDADAQRAGLRR